MTTAACAAVSVALPLHGALGISIVSFSTTGQIITGAVVSCTKIVALQVDELPQESVAVHVLVTLNSTGHDPRHGPSSNVIVTVASHASVVLATPKIGKEGQSTIP